MKRLLFSAVILMLVAGCAAPPAGDPAVESGAPDASHNQEADSGDDGSLVDEDFDAGETGELEPAEADTDEDRT